MHNSLRATKTIEHPHVISWHTCVNKTILFLEETLITNKILFTSYKKLHNNQKKC